MKASIEFIKTKLGCLMFLFLLPHTGKTFKFFPLCSALPLILRNFLLVSTETCPSSELPAVSKASITQPTPASLLFSCKDPGLRLEGFRMILQFSFTLLKAWGDKSSSLRTNLAGDFISQNWHTKLLASYLTMIPWAGERINSLSASLKIWYKMSRLLFYGT